MSIVELYSAVYKLGPEMRTREPIVDYENLESKNLGQYMTPRFVAEFMCSLISRPKSAKVLEPGAGEGVFVDVLKDSGFRNITAYEIDEKLIRKSNEEIIQQNFLDIPREPVFDVIIGNPPYIRWKNIPSEWQTLFLKEPYWNKIMNGLCDMTYAYIYHSLNVLKNKGELIFISPIFWTQTLHANKLREHMAKLGSLELFIDLNEAKVFDGVSSSIMIFKFVKGTKLPKVKVAQYESKERVTSDTLSNIGRLLSEIEKQVDTPEAYVEEEKIIAYHDEQFFTTDAWHPIPPTSQIVREIGLIEDHSTLGSISEIGNGMVSGLDKAFKLDYDIGELNERELESLIYVYKAITLERFAPRYEPIPYIFINHVSSEKDLKRDYPLFYRKLIGHKEKLEKRYQYNREIPYWHWVFLRNKHLFEDFNAKIFIPSKERFDTRGYFRFALVENLSNRVHYATQDVTTICLDLSRIKEGIDYILGLLNSEPIQKWIRTKGFKRGNVYDFSEQPLSIIPVPRIKWKDSKQVELHSKIVEIVSETLKKKQLEKIDELDECVTELLKLKKKVVTTSLDSFV